MFSCKYCENFKNNYFEEHMWTAASEFSKKKKYFSSYLLRKILKCSTHFSVRTRQKKKSFTNFRSSYRRTSIKKLFLKVSQYTQTLGVSCLNKVVDPQANDFRERWQLSFVTLNGNLAVNLKTTHPPLLNGRAQFTFLKTKSSHSSGIVVYPPKFEFLKN